MQNSSFHFNIVSFLFGNTSDFSWSSCSLSVTVDHGFSVISTLWPESIIGAVRHYYSKLPPVLRLLLTHRTDVAAARYLEHITLSDTMEGVGVGLKMGLIWGWATFSVEHRKPAAHQNRHSFMWKSCLKKLLLKILKRRREGETQRTREW